MIEPLVLPLAEAARYLGVSTDTMRRLSKTRALPVVQLSPRRIAFKKADLDAYVDSVTDRRTTA